MSAVSGGVRLNFRRLQFLNIFIREKKCIRLTRLPKAGINKK